MTSLATGAEGRWRLLAIDDHPHSAELVARVGKQCGYETQCMVETQSLAHMLIAWAPHVIALDLKMPRADGFDVLAMLKVMNFTGQLILVSGEHPGFRRAACKQAAAAGLQVAADICKPVDIKVLRALLAELKQSFEAGRDIAFRSVG
jgi:CheY-like chemotaxis protein